ncbi:unnamed protein product [Parascedosporium putredinis]|uniref:CENP-V/GFA domain-containing protein n=1 Tax=Parascedosporium putredinis TaxID=1442378 RepID=A0A9P1MAB1_9PEZI|nr:unnamed protein product [Parascedosporium putredinis]CAI7997331.1 unnamed protein product [Parascedosporium putredinis]
MSSQALENTQWTEKPPYIPASQRSGFTSRHRGSCHCGKIQYSLNREEPLASKYCHCSDCQTLHGRRRTVRDDGAPFQWAAIFQKDDMAFDNGSEGLVFYRSATRELGHDLPCKVSCGHCRTPIMDEGRNMVLLFPTLIKFPSEAARRLFKPQVLDIADDAVKWSGLDGKSERLDS